MHVTSHYICHAQKLCAVFYICYSILNNIFPGSLVESKMVYLPGLFVTLKIEMKHCIVGYHTQCSLHLLNVEGHMSIQCMQNIYILVCPVQKLSTAESVLYFNIF